MEDANWGVVKNGLDFLESSVGYLSEPDDRNLKYATLHLFASMETLLKARLAREHWTLVSAYPDKITITAFNSGDFKSVTITQAIQRLVAIGGVTIDGKAVDRITAVEKLRNRAAHFSLRGETQERVAAIVAGGLDFMLEFIEKELRPEARPREASLIDATLHRTRGGLGKIQVLVAERMQSLGAILGTYSIVLDCPACRQPSLVLTEDVAARCLYCLFGPDGSTIAEEYVTVILEISRDNSEGIGWPVHPCERCHEVALVDYIYTVEGEEIGSICFSCSYVLTGK